MAEGLGQQDLDRVNKELDNLGKNIGIGLAISGAAAGIEMLVASTVESIARQPEAADSLNESMYAGIYACVGLAIGAITTILVL